MNAATQNHEAAHAALAIAAAGWVPVEVRVDGPDPYTAGRCVANWRDGEPDFGWLVAVLGGPLSQGHVIDWRPRDDADTADERVAAALVEGLGFERHRFLDALAVANHLLGQHEVREMVRLIALGLGVAPVLNERQLRELLGPECLAHFNIDPEGVTTP